MSDNTPTGSRPGPAGGYFLRLLERVAPAEPPLRRRQASRFEPVRGAAASVFGAGSMTPGDELAQEETRSTGAFVQPHEATVRVDPTIRTVPAMPMQPMPARPGPVLQPAASMAFGEHAGPAVQPAHGAAAANAHPGDAAGNEPARAPAGTPTGVAASLAKAALPTPARDRFAEPALRQRRTSADDEPTPTEAAMARRALTRNEPPPAPTAAHAPAPLPRRGEPLAPTVRRAATSLASTRPVAVASPPPALPPVQVTIGRIELRAAPASAAPAGPARSRPGAPRLGLEQYLRDRGGRR